MQTAFRKSIKRVLKSVGVDVRRAVDGKAVPLRFPPEFAHSDKAVFALIREKNLTMVSNERLTATILACHYVCDRGIEGDFVECGVWRGGNSIAAASVFKSRSVNRSVYLFDTFEGMTEPTDDDKMVANGSSAMDIFRKRRRDDRTDWCYAPIDEVSGHFAAAGLLGTNVHLVKGDVQDTLEREELLPRKISVLRLDTDWYESTRRELEVLYPRLSEGGVLLLDDYGFWAGAKKAVDEYFIENRNRPLLQNVDVSGRLGIKVSVTPERRQ